MEQSEQTEGNRLIGTERCQTGVGVGVSKEKGLGNTNWLSQSHHGDVKQSVVNIVNYMVVTGARWVPD